MPGSDISFPGIFASTGISPFSIENTEFNIMWGWGHNDCDTPTGLRDWVNAICP